MKDIRVSKTGYDAKTETDPRNYIFYGSKNTFKIIAEGSLLSQTVNSSYVDFEISHNQSSLPAVFAFIKYPDGYVALPNSSPADYTYFSYRNWDIQITATKVRFRVYKLTSTTYNVDIKYYIFEAPGL